MQRKGSRLWLQVYTSKERRGKEKGRDCGCQCKERRTEAEVGKSDFLAPSGCRAHGVPIPVCDEETNYAAGCAIREWPQSSCEGAAGFPRRCAARDGSEAMPKYVLDAVRHGFRQGAAAKSSAIGLQLAVRIDAD